MTNSPPAKTLAGAWHRLCGDCVSVFHRYARWLVATSWVRLFALALLLIFTMSLLRNVAPFSWTYTEWVPLDGSITSLPLKANRGSFGDWRGEHLAKGEGVDISIDENGVRVTARAPALPAPALPAPAQGASAGASAPLTAAAKAPVSEPVAGLPVVEVNVKLPPGADSYAVRQAMAQAQREMLAALQEMHQANKNARQETVDALDQRLVVHRYGDTLMPLTWWFILLSGIIKLAYQGRLAAEAKAVHAAEVAESESLKRQVVEARLAAMQAQVEPHFLFNTLASIDHLIETDPPRASTMQKHLIALLRASMPSMREANAQGTRDLGRELAVIRPYLEILKVRMEERLQTAIRVSEGLYSAEFPPMMLQSLVENAIKHGLEPKAEGGLLTVSAEVSHNTLAVTVTDTGLGLGKAPTAGTGIGLSNIRERLALLYGDRASLNVKDLPEGGTSATITVPYTVRAPQQPDALA